MVGNNLTPCRQHHNNCIIHQHQNGGQLCMKGYIGQKGSKFYVDWYWQGKHHKVYQYKGEPIYHRSIAEKLRSAMQSDTENGTFRIEKYIGEQFSDVCEYLDTWVESIKAGISPGTYNTYRPIINRQLKPFFQARQIFLHDIQYDTLIHLLSAVQGSPVYKATCLRVMHACLTYAWRSGRIPTMPPFPERKYFQMQEKPIEWIPSSRQMEIISHIPAEHRPIFLWLKYHLRRPSEACALHWSDYDPAEQCFIIRHNISGRQLVERTKTGLTHMIPCHDEFKPVLRDLRRSNIGKFVFTHPKSQSEGGRYNIKYLQKLWDKAKAGCGETISMYHGLKTSSCSQYVNEQGLSLPELQSITGHASMDAVKKYASVELARKRELMHTRIVPFKKAGNE